jgi:hypothetical protein
MYESDLLKILETYKKTDVKIVKENIKNACKKLYKQHGGRYGIAKLMNMELNAFQSCLNPSHSSNLTFENLIKFCGTLNLDISAMLAPVDVVKSNRGVDKFWTYDTQTELIARFDLGGIDYVKEKFNLSDKTILHYYNLFTREIKEIDG